jgi:hypothetical protein
VNDVYSNFINFCFVGSKNAKCAHIPCDGAFWQYEVRVPMVCEGYYGTVTNKQTTYLIIYRSTGQGEPMSRAPLNEGDNLESGDLL